MGPLVKQIGFDQFMILFNDSQFHIHTPPSVILGIENEISNSGLTVF